MYLLLVCVRNMQVCCEKEHYESIQIPTYANKSTVKKLQRAATTDKFKKKVRTNNLAFHPPPSIF